MKVLIAQVDDALFDGEAVSLTVPTLAGELTILGEHEPLITVLKEGTLTVRTDTAEKTFTVHGGAMEVRREGVTVIL